MKTFVIVGVSLAAGLARAQPASDPQIRPTLTSVLVGANTVFGHIVANVEEAVALFLRDSSHGSYHPSAKLSPAIGQVSRYIDEVDRNRNSIIAVDKVDPSKIRARIIIGRDGTEEQRAALRNFNAHLYRIEIITFDQLLKIAERVLLMFQNERPAESLVDPSYDDDIPF